MCPARRGSVRPDLAALAERKGLKVFNRQVSPLQDGPRKGVRLDVASGQGVAYVEGLEFANGTINSTSAAATSRGKVLSGSPFTERTR